MMNESMHSADRSLTELAQRAAARFQREYGRAARWLVAAPGRVNVIGEHTDYNDGFVLPMAIERYVVLAADASSIGPREVRLCSSELNDHTHFSISADLTPTTPTWSNYVRGVVAGYLQRDVTPSGFDATIDSNVPIGGGLSSSAALLVATATLIEAMTGQTLDPLDRALLCQKAEHEFAGTPSGIMDMFTSIMGRRDHLLLLDCRSLAHRPIALNDPAVTVLIVNSKVKHELARGEDGVSAYAQRREQCESAARAMGLRALRDATIDDVNAAQLDDVVRRRARHVVTEIARTLDAAEAIERRQWSRAGELMYASHASLRDDFEVSVRELDVLVEIAAAIGAAGGVYGSRMTGGGFGGCTVSLVRTDAAQDIARRIADEYEKRIGHRPDTFISHPADGARVIA